MPFFVSTPRFSSRALLLIAGLAFLAGCQTSPSQQAHRSDSGAESIPTQTTYERNRGIILLKNAKGPRSEIETITARTLWGRIRQGFMLDPTAIDNPRIDRQRLAYSSESRYFEMTSKRSERYLHYVVEQLDERGMPLELALLPFVESGYNPMALSRSQAAGIWQFIPSTGKVFDLRQDSWYDGRRDITASTQAALDYLSKLNEMFDGDWLLAIAAYNCGEGCVGRAVAANRAKGLPADYWSLDLPHETMNYVPKLLALSQIIERPELHGTVLPELADSPYFAAVTIERQLDLHKAAELADIPTEDFIKLNPAFKQRVTAPGAYQLLVPIDRLEQFSTALAELPEDEHVKYQRYNVRAGDNLSQIASRHNVKVSALREVNQLDSNLLRVGQVLMLPLSANSLSAQVVSDQAVSASRSAPSATATSYRVRPGDNLWEIARKHGISVASLKQQNLLDTPALQVGQTLKIPGQARSSQAEQSTRKPIVYKVKPGDSLFSIARQFNIAIDRIREHNDLGRHLQPGQELTLNLY
ncbi:lytic transglycosylase [Halopseudomonas salina]|uniref:Murein transglycosylase n=1 Tax=Halopseudomonas salina TaxID=1323744 RepID=A0ABQ1Q328_9GAMM|nr:LysM peptidoglycan-binding domain-containing protein [Halopseudomonas salina]GGD10174.1 murein transglycosylase [Halopseudomonas salina]